MTNQYDVIIVGAGPAGMFAALELVKSTPALKIAIFEKGKVRMPEKPHSIVSGWGGAGAFSDGKLTLTPLVGGQLQDVISSDRFDNLMRYVDDLYIEFGGDPDRLFGGASAETDMLQRKALAANLDLIHYEIRHLGTDKSYRIVENIRACLEAHHTDIFMEAEVQTVTKEHGLFTVSVRRRQSTAEVFTAASVILAPGREGAEWFVREAKRLGLKMNNKGVDVGVRVEVRAETLKHITELLYELKAVYYSTTFDDKVRTFCMCPYGFVALENYRGLITANGHSYATRKSKNTNFALLVTESFTEPFDDPLKYGQSVSRLANLLGETVLVQRLGDLRAGRRSTPARIERGLVTPTLKKATPGDLSLVLPYRQMVDILEMLEAMETIAPGIASKHTLLYGVEIKFYSSHVEMREGFETAIDGLYAIGDGAGITRGLLQASMCGVLAAQHLLRN
ncbi:FAD-dependent oxidoreductase [candidate division KSB3 bacterium]|uniref:FAD-dependent oxidoreductase n=1 Tax=candidate division KSB3 bacterium TaxID=2044937 RepID=A0A2G6E6Y6_9BACT|nr:MAG: FAD-dependent oxidoreductase [candidate division KSB3 bacterium]PIE30049.1 MAG: FAD-dependent oxidoreductase [candidate division KSB3 bacterium]